MQICCWNRLFEGTLLRLVISRLCLLSGAGCLVGMVDHTSVYVPHVAVPAGKLWFLGKSRSNPLCMGEGLGCRFCLTWVPGHIILSYVEGNPIFWISEQIRHYSGCTVTESIYSEI